MQSSEKNKGVRIAEALQQRVPTAYVDDPASGFFVFLTVVLALAMIVPQTVMLVYMTVHYETAWGEQMITRTAVRTTSPAFPNSYSMAMNPDTDRSSVAYGCFLQAGVGKDAPGVKTDSLPEYITTMRARSGCDITASDVMKGRDYTFFTCIAQVFPIDTHTKNMVLKCMDTVEGVNFAYLQTSDTSLMFGSFNWALMMFTSMLITGIFYVHLAGGWVVVSRADTRTAIAGGNSGFVMHRGYMSWKDANFMQWFPASYMCTVLALIMSLLFILGAFVLAVPPKGKLSDTDFKTDSNGYIPSTPTTFSVCMFALCATAAYLFAHIFISNRETRKSDVIDDPNLLVPGASVKPIRGLGAQLDLDMTQRYPSTFTKDDSGQFHAESSVQLEGGSEEGCFFRPVTEAMAWCNLFADPLFMLGMIFPTMSPIHEDVQRLMVDVVSAKAIAVAISKIAPRAVLWHFDGRAKNPKDGADWTDSDNSKYATWEKVYASSLGSDKTVNYIRAMHFCGHVAYIELMCAVAYRYSRLLIVPQALASVDPLSYTMGTVYLSVIVCAMDMAWSAIQATMVYRSMYGANFERSRSLLVAFNCFFMVQALCKSAFAFASAYAVAPMLDHYTQQLVKFLA